MIDSTVLVSRFLNPAPGGVAFDLLNLVRTKSCEACISPQILEEVRRVLRYSRIRKRYNFTDEDVEGYCLQLGEIAMVIDPPPTVRRVRDPNDDMVLDCALMAAAQYVVTRDDDLLSLGSFEGIAVVTPEAFLGLLRRKGRHT